ncbi:glycerophosphodiester phosphodiesterase family protein [Cellulomonas sp. ATA003]|uniref:glycerophosphodiester phosphodiesterase n=1 Tax=Cellulomonas sp. ATA003 TaxID=3073064 RepID=UPI0028737190|nr:glycerophosphodiester phosphodiesterase family protein [Cellulomonas sp. ATA003]WNB84894.1 glycerophosphodiester phosphodiesterase family protein [Cellulomonas sp. ATA003]
MGRDQGLGTAEQRVPRLADLLEISRSSGIPLVLDQKHPVAAMAAARLVDRMHVPTTAFCGSTEGLVAIRAARPDATIYLNDAAYTPPDIRLLATVRPQFYNPLWTNLSPGTVHAMRTFGIALCCWTPNEDADLALVLDLGVDAVMTDRPGRLRALLEERADAGRRPAATSPTTPGPTSSQPAVYQPAVSRPAVPAVPQRALSGAAG